MNPQNVLVKRSADLLKPVSDYFSVYCASDSLTFSEFIRNVSINSNDKILVSFNIVNLYTNVLTFTRNYTDMCRRSL